MNPRMDNRVESLEKRMSEMRSEMIEMKGMMTSKKEFMIELKDLVITKEGKEKSLKGQTFGNLGSMFPEDWRRNYAEEIRASCAC